MKYRIKTHVTETRKVKTKKQIFQVNENDMYNYFPKTTIFAA